MSDMCVENATKLASFVLFVFVPFLVCPMLPYLDGQ